MPWLDGVTNAKRQERLPVVLTKAEVAAVLARTSGVSGLLARLLTVPASVPVTKIRPKKDHLATVVFVYRLLFLLYFIGGAEEDRTPDLRIANATLSRLSYRPNIRIFIYYWLMAWNARRSLFHNL